MCADDALKLPRGARAAGKGKGAKRNNRIPLVPLLPRFTVVAFRGTVAATGGLGFDWRLQVLTGANVGAFGTSAHHVDAALP